ncbi:MAG TPA: hypothetical protein VLV31_06600 [Candidatus Acidoferrales bacterium]|nr:hypothetical protein [Candidatus Acidoferrales bacterium]
MRTKTLLRILPYLAGLLFAGMALAGYEISAETAAMFDAQPGSLTDSVDIQVLWFQGKACVVQLPDNYFSNCTYLPAINVMLALTVLLIALLVIYGLLRKRVNLLPTKRPPTKFAENS